MASILLFNKNTFRPSPSLARKAELLWSWANSASEISCESGIQLCLSTIAVLKDAIIKEKAGWLKTKSKIRAMERERLYRERGVNQNRALELDEQQPPPLQQEEDVRADDFRFELLNADNEIFDENIADADEDFEGTDSDQDEINHPIDENETLLDDDEHNSLYETDELENEVSNTTDNDRSVNRHKRDIDYVLSSFDKVELSDEDENTTDEDDLQIEDTSFSYSFPPKDNCSAKKQCTDKSLSEKTYEYKSTEQVTQAFSWKSGKVFPSNSKIVKSETSKKISLSASRCM